MDALTQSAFLSPILTVTAWNTEETGDIYKGHLDKKGLFLGKLFEGGIFRQTFLGAFWPLSL